MSSQDRLKSFSRQLNSTAPNLAESTQQGLESKSNSRLVALALVLVGAVYFTTLSPTIYWRDSPELADAAYTLGIAHPAGSPVYTLTGKALTYLPIGTIPFRTNVLSAIAALTALALMAACAWELVSRVQGHVSLWEQRLAATIPPILLGLSAPYWHNALVTEVYSLHLAFFGGVVLLLLRWGRTKDDRLALSAAFLFGLTLGIHAASFLFAPGLLVFFLWKRPADQIKKLVLILFFVLLGLSTYLYLPLRAASNPPFNWGNPQTLRGFWTQVSDEKDRAHHFSFVNKQDAPKLLLARAEMAIRDLTPFVAMLSVIGAAGLRKYPAFLFLGLEVIGMNVLFFLGWESGTIFSPSYFFACLFSSVGLASSAHVLGRLSNRFLRPVFLMWIAGVSLVPLVFFKNLGRVTLSQAFLPREVSASSLYALEPGGTIVSGLFWFHFRYHQDIERLRDDIAILSAGQFNRSKYFGSPRAQDLAWLRLPRIRFPEEGKARKFLAELISINAARAPLYWGMEWDLSSPFLSRLAPESGFLFRARPVGKEPDWPEIRSYLRALELGLARQIKSETFFRDEEVAEWYLPFLPTLSFYLRHHGYNRQALGVAMIAYNLFERRARQRGLDQDVAVLQFINGNPLKAEDFFIKHLELFPRDFLSSYNTGILLAERGKYQEALHFMTKAAKLRPGSADVHQALWAIHITLGNREAAREEFSEYSTLSRSSRSRSGLE